MDKIKIVFILGTLDIGGTEKQFIKMIRRLTRNEFELRVLAFSRSGKLRTEIEALHIPFQSLRFSGLQGKFHPGSYVQLYRLICDMVRYLRQEKPHIVQTYLFWPNIYGCIAARFAGVPCIITGRRASMEKRYMTFPFTWLQNLSNLWATAILTNSHHVKQECLQQDKHVTDEKIVVIYNGIEIERYIVNFDTTKKKKALRVPDDSLMVGIVASLHPRKGHRDFLKAATLVLQIYPRTIFLVVGRDEGVRTSLEALAKELHISDSIIFTGERDDIPELLSIIDIQVSSSFIEGLSNSILEGMAAGKPIIATHVSGTPELVVHEKTGLLVPPGNPQRLAEAIIRILSDRELRIQMGNAGRQRIKNFFPIDQMIDQTEAFYRNLVNQMRNRC